MYASRYIRNRRTTVGEPVSSCQAHSRGSRSLPSPISPSLAAPPAELRFTVKVAADPFASAMEEQVPVATLHYDTSARRVRLTNPSIYQPLFLNGARVFSLEGVTLTEGCVVEVHPSLLREGQGLTADPSLPPSAEATGQSDLATLSPPPPLGPHRSAQPCGARSSLSPQAGKRTPERPTQHTATDAFVQFGDGPRDRKVSFAHVVGRAVANGAAHHPASVEDADSANLLDMGRKDRSFALPEMPRRSSTQQPPSSPENSVVVVVAAAARTCGAEACVTWCPAGASVFWTQTEEATAPLAADGTPMPSLVNACPPLAGMTLHEASVSGGGSFPLSIRHPTLTTEQQPSTDMDAAASAGSEDSDSSSSCGAVHDDLTLSPVALYVSSRHGVVEGTIARAGPGGTRAARALSAQATTPAAAASFSTDRRRLSSLVSDTILSQRTRRLFANPTTLCGMGERRVPPTVAATAAATACGAGKRTLEILSLHFDARGRCLRPFSPAEKLVLYEQFAVAIRSWRHRLRHTKTVLRLSSPLFCCGEVNGNFAALWGAVLQPLCPFGRLSLLGTPLLLLGNYLGDAGEEEEADTDGGVHVMLALAALSAASPDSIHLLRGRGEVFSEDRRAQLRSRSIAYFGAANGREFARAVVDLLSSLPLAAVVDESIFASHSGIPPVPLHVLPGYEWVAHERCFFDQVLAGVVPHSCFQTVDVAASDNALHGKTAATKSQEVYRRLLEALVGIRASPDEASSHPAKSASSCPFPPLSRATSPRGGVGIAEALRGFLQRYEFSMVLHGVGGGDAGVCVTNQARLVNLSTAPGDAPGSLGSHRSGGGSACIVTPGTVQLVCWRSASLPPSPSARASPTPEDDRHACSPSRHPVGSTVRRQHRPAQALSTSMSTVHYVMGVPMPLGRAYFYNPDPDGVLTVSRELTSSFSPRGQRSRSSSILTLSEDREVEYG